MLLSSSLTLVCRFHRAPYGFIGDAIVFGDLAEGIALLDAAEHIGPLFGGNAVMRVSRARSSLLAWW